MSSLANTSISISKKDLTKNRLPPVASRSVVFYHKATAGQITINLNSLTMPSEMPSQVQATNDEISGAKLVLNKKNLSLTSSANGQLIQGLDYLVTDGFTLQLIGPYAGVGAEVDEIFVGTIVNSPISDVAVISSKDMIVTTTAAIGQTTVNLGNEYKVGANTLQDIGAVRIWINGVLALRGQDYLEVDSGNGFGSTIELVASPTLTPWQIVADFGVRAVTDQDALGTIQSLGGSILKLANDVADIAGTTASDYYSASPSDVERRTFGDTILNLNSKYDTTSTLSAYTKTRWQRKYLASNLTSVTPDIASLRFNNLTIGKTYKIHASFYVQSTSGGDGSWTVTNNGVNMIAGTLNVDGTATTVGARIDLHMPAFVATASTLIANIATITGTFTIFGTGNEAGTWIQVEELPNHEITTAWT